VRFTGRQRNAQRGQSFKIEKFFELRPSSASKNPSAARPRFSNSRIAEALLGMRVLKRHVSSARSSAGDSMI